MCLFFFQYGAECICVGTFTQFWSNDHGRDCFLLCSSKV